MSRRIIDLDAPDRFVAGRVPGPAGESLILQAVQGRRVVSVVLEPDQLGLLADRTLVIVGELERRGLVAIDAGSAGVAEELALADPWHEEFRAGTLTIAWDDDGDRIIIEAQALAFDAGAGESAPLPGEEFDRGVDAEVPDDDPLGPDLLRVRLTPWMAQRFARQAAQMASSG